jgi:hypothetical protein
MTSSSATFNVTSLARALLTKAALQSLCDLAYVRCNFNNTGRRLVSVKKLVRHSLRLPDIQKLTL